MITDINQLDFTKRYTYADYLTWQFEEMVELIQGRVYRMSPAPGTSHQRISSNLHRIISNYCNQKTCQIFHAPFDVRLPLPPDRQTPDKVDTVVQPDLSVICDLAKLDERGCQGPPDWIIEILSPATATKDLTEKFDLYQHAGVREYWVVHPLEGTLLVYSLNEFLQYQLLRITPFTVVDQVAAVTFPDLVVDLGEVF